MDLRRGIPRVLAREDVGSRRRRAAAHRRRRFYRAATTREHEPLRVLLCGPSHEEPRAIPDGYGAVAHARWFHQTLELTASRPGRRVARRAAGERAGVPRQPHHRRDCAPHARLRRARRPRLHLDRRRGHGRRAAVRPRGHPQFRDFDAHKAPHENAVELASGCSKSSRTGTCASNWRAPDAPRGAMRAPRPSSLVWKNTSAPAAKQTA